MADNLQTFIIIFNENGQEIKVSDKDINSENVAVGYAKKVYMENGMDLQSIQFGTYARGLNADDIISVILPEYNVPKDLTKSRFVIKEIRTEYIGKTAYDTITGERYD